MSEINERESEGESTHFTELCLFYVALTELFYGPKCSSHRVCHCESSYAPLAQCIWTGSPKISILRLPRLFYRDTLILLSICGNLLWFKMFVSSSV